MDHFGGVVNRAGHSRNSLQPAENFLLLRGDTCPRG